MPHLLGLPNETLLQIIASTDVEDIESFSSCSKHIRLLFGPVLQLHMERKRRFSKIELGRPHTHVTSPHAIMLLRDVLESPAIAQYPTKLVIGDCVDKRYDWPDWLKERQEEWENEISAAITQCTGILPAKLYDCPYIRQSEMQDWKLEICGGDEETIAAFLVTLFPNLKSIAISDTKIYPIRLVEVVSKIAVAHRSSPDSFHPLQKLNSVRLERCCVVFGAWYHVLEPFAELRSVRKISGNMVQGCGDDWGIEEDNESDDEDEDGYESEDENESEDAEKSEIEDELETNIGTASDDREDKDMDEDEYEYEIVESGGGITCLNFKDSAIDVQSFNKILRGTKALQKFGYNFDHPVSVRAHIMWEPAAILRSLLFYAGHSLVCLDLTGSKGSWNVCVGDSPYLTNSPRHFQVLKWMYVQDGIFVEEKEVLEHPMSAQNP